MKIDVMEKSKEKMQFSIDGINPAYANSIRRYMNSEVPVMAIEDVEFRKNDSILYDELIAHRLGLLPLKTDLKSYVLPKECKCKGVGCNKCTLKMTLKTKAPGTVYASQIKSKDPAVVPVYPKTPIVKLLENQELEIEATAMLGQGKMHAKWSPGLIFYKYKDENEDDSFIFTIESWGQLTPKEIVVAALEMFNADLEAFVEMVKNIKE